jgi:hypothetical protein
MWFGMDATQLKPLSDALEELDWSKSEDKIRELSTADPTTNDDLKKLIRRLVEKGVAEDAARRLIAAWALASEKMRKENYEKIRELKATRRPIVQCQVCGRKAFYWAPCYVAPMIIDWEDIVLPEYHGRKL